MYFKVPLHIKRDTIGTSALTYGCLEFKKALFLELLFVPFETVKAISSHHLRHLNFRYFILYSH